jgi:membrane protein required for colicin V production
MTWFDLAMLGVLALSALLAFFRGFVREVLGVGAWAGAILLGFWFFPYVSPRFETWIHAREFADPAAFAAVFLVSLIVLSVISSWAGALVRGSALGGVDRTLGIVFGLVRGAVMLIFCYVAAGLVTVPQDWPEPIRSRRVWMICCSRRRRARPWRRPQDRRGARRGARRAPASRDRARDVESRVRGIGR